MVEGDDRTDRSSACGGSGDDGRQPNGPEKLDWYECPKRPPKLARDRNPFPAPGLTTLDKVREQVSDGELCDGDQWRPVIGPPLASSKCLSFAVPVCCNTSPTSFTP